MSSGLEYTRTPKEKGIKMGLDMFLYNSRKEEIGYWRKANHIHNWFVKNVQNGVDDCGSYSVSKEQLNDLYKICSAVMENKDSASTLLPTADGFFFGSTEYGEGYYEDILDTMKILENIDKSEENFIYGSSW
jgi:hypothetical protein